MTRTVLAALTLSLMATTALAAPRKTDGLCALPMAAQSDAVATGPNPFGYARMARIDEMIGRYVAAYPDRTAGWDRPAALPTYVIWDCGSGIWRRHVAQARKSGTIAMIYEMAVGNDGRTLAVAIHERAHQWQPAGTLDTPEMEAAAKRAERVIMGWNEK